MDVFQMRARHGENMRRAFDESGGERLAPKVPDVDALIFQDFDGKKAGRLPSDGVYTRGSDFDIAPVAEQLPEKTFRHGAAADVSSTDEKNVFHRGKRATALGPPN